MDNYSDLGPDCAKGFGCASDFRLRSQGKTARPRGFFPGSSSSCAQEHYGHGTIRSEQGWDRSLDLRDCRGPTLVLCACCACWTLPVLWGSPEGTLGPARVFALLQAGSGFSGGPGTLSPPLLSWIRSAAF